MPDLILLTSELLEELRAAIAKGMEPRNAEWDAIAGKLEALGGTWTCGAYPVQAKGEVDGHPWYFRARHEHWRFSVASPGGDAVGVGIGDEPGWSRCEEWGEDEEAGWMPPAVALGLIVECLDQWRRGELPKVEVNDG